MVESLDIYTCMLCVTVMLFWGILFDYPLPCRLECQIGMEVDSCAAFDFEHYVLGLRFADVWPLAGQGRC